MQLPDATSPSLHLSHPTPAEKISTWTLNSKNWGTALSLDSYLQRESYMTTVPLSKDGGITHWILISLDSTPDSRPIFGSVETIRKRALISKDGAVKETITHGIGSVFCNPAYRGKGYGSRMLKELGPALKEWQTDKNIKGREECGFSVLWSDIGKKYYAKHGWVAFPSSHILFPPLPSPSAFPSASTPDSSQAATPLTDPDIEALCTLDDAYLRKELSEAKDGKKHVAILPDYETMQWHHHREDFMTSSIFNKSPTIRGAIAGPPGKRVWAIWTRAFYGPVEKIESGNTLHFLRLVIEDEGDVEGNAERLRGIVQIAQREAAEWKCVGVEVWNPTTSLKAMVEKMGLEYKEVDRDEESISSLMWYGEGTGSADEIEWVGNEKFGWC